MAWQAAQGDVCGGCGRPRDECFDPEGPDYFAVPLRCRACEARDREAADFVQGGNPAGMYYQIRERERTWLNAP